MKPAYIAVVCFLAHATCLVAENVVITPEAAPYIVAAFSKVDTPITELALLFPAYRNASDEFSRAEALTGLKPKIERAIQQMKAAERFEVHFNVVLSEYDFESETFDLEWKDYPQTAIYPETPGLVTNRIRLAKTEAKRLIQSLGSSRKLEAVLEGTLRSGFLDDLLHSPVVYLHGRKLILRDATGNIVAEHVAYLAPEHSYSKSFPVYAILPSTLSEAMKKANAWQCWNVLDKRAKIKGVLNLQSDGKTMTVSVSNEVIPIEGGDSLESGGRLPLETDESGVFPSAVTTKLFLPPNEWVHFNASQDPAVAYSAKKSQVEVFFGESDKPSKDSYPDMTLRDGKPGRTIPRTVGSRSVYPWHLYFRTKADSGDEVIVVQSKEQYGNPPPSQ